MPASPSWRVHHRDVTPTTLIKRHTIVECMVDHLGVLTSSHIHYSLFGPLATSSYIVSSFVMCPSSLMTSYPSYGIVDPNSSSSIGIVLAPELSSKCGSSSLPTSTRNAFYSQLNKDTICSDISILCRIRSSYPFT